MRRVVLPSIIHHFPRIDTVVIMNRVTGTLDIIDMRILGVHDDLDTHMASLSLTLTSNLLIGRIGAAMNILSSDSGQKFIGTIDTITVDDKPIECVLNSNVKELHPLALRELWSMFAAGQ